MSEREIVIIGGGPVGLWTAIQTKKRIKDSKINVYERFETYQRNHVLRLDYWSLILYAKNLDSESERKFIKEITGKTYNQLKLKPAKSIFIKTNDLEDALKTHANELGINIVYQKVDSLESIEELHPNCETFIVADGANSSFRKALLGENDVERTPLQYIVEMKYSVENKTSSANLKDIFKVNSKNEFMAFEYIGRFRKNTTPISIRFFIDENTYEKIPGATFKKPLSFEDLNNNTEINNLATTINNYLNFRKEKYGDILIEDKIKISKLPLYIYSAREFGIKRNEKCWFLVGDAAIGVPYFRALNSGLILASKLSQILKTQRLGVSSSMQVKAYNIYRPFHIQTEFKIAEGKNMILKTFNKIRKIHI